MEDPHIEPRHWQTWRRLHLLASGLVLLIGAVHCGLTPLLYDQWTPEAVWFLGTGLSLLLVGALNWAHVGTEPCRLPTVRLVKVANWLFVAYGMGAVLAVPEPQAMAVLVGLAGQAIIAHKTLPGPA